MGNAARAIYESAQQIGAKYDQNNGNDDTDLLMTEHVKINSAEKNNLWSVQQENGALINRQYTFDAHIQSDCDDLNNVENEILNEMMYPPQPSMNAPRPMMDIP